MGQVSGLGPGFYFPSHILCERWVARSQQPLRDIASVDSGTLSTWTIIASLFILRKMASSSLSSLMVAFTRKQPNCVIVVIVKTVQDSCNNLRFRPAQNSKVMRPKGERGRRWSRGWCVITTCERKNSRKTGLNRIKRWVKGSGSSNSGKLDSIYVSVPPDTSTEPAVF